MSLARRYRVRFGAARGDRLLLYLVTALAMHAGAATSAFVTLRDWQATPPEEVASTPIEFVYLDGADDQAEDTARRAQSDAMAQGRRLAHRPINAGKEAATESQKAGVATGEKPVDSTTLGIAGEIVPAQYDPTPPAPTPGAAAPTPEAVADPKALDSEPPALSPPPMDAPIPALPSVESVPPIPESIRSVEPTPPSRMLPDSPLVPVPLAAAEPLPLESSAEEPEAIAPGSPEPVVDTEEEAPQAQPIPATAGLEGVPNPDHAGAEGPVQVAAQRDAVLGDYMAQTDAQIYAVWEDIPMDETRQVRVQFEIDRQGHLQRVELTSPSGSTTADQAALEAVRRAAPFEPFPEAIAYDHLLINMTFRYSVTTTDPAIPAAPSPRF